MATCRVWLAPDHSEIFGVMTHLGLADLLLDNFRSEIFEFEAKQNKNDEA